MRPYTPAFIFVENAMLTTTTRIAKVSEITNGWIVIDAEGVVVGRLASFIAKRLRGKHRADFTPNVDTGDFVVVINAQKVTLTGKKWKEKIYTHHSGYPGGLKQASAEKIAEKKPERLITMAVQGMLPKNKMGRKLIKKLKVYAGDAHPHQAQQPEAHTL